jgi:hypothetical protein
MVRDAIWWIQLVFRTILWGLAGAGWLLMTQNIVRSLLP